MGCFWTVAGTLACPGAVWLPAPGLRVVVPVGTAEDTAGPANLGCSWQPVITREHGSCAWALYDTKGSVHAGYLFDLVNSPQMGHASNLILRCIQS